MFLTFSSKINNNNSKQSQTHMIKHKIHQWISIARYLGRHHGQYAKFPIGWWCIHCLHIKIHRCEIYDATARSLRVYSLSGSEFSLTCVRVICRPREWIDSQRFVNPSILKNSSKLFVKFRQLSIAPSECKFLLGAV